MNSHFNSIEEIIADERFLAWYFRSNDMLAKEWKRWLSVHPENKPLVEESIAYLDELYVQEGTVSEAKIDMAFEKLDASLGTYAPVVNIKQKRSYWWMIAAGAIVILVTSFFFWGIDTGKTVLESGYGQIKAYELPDGSQVTLNAKSEITVSKNWEKGAEREVWLKGEAFFKVQKTMAKSKFVVHTNATDIIVTGTQFNVTTEEDQTNVLLTEGSVLILTHDGQELHMVPGDFVTIHNKQAEKTTINEEKVLAWRQSKLVFDNTSMKEVAQIITNHYGIKVTLSDRSITEKRISGVMPNNSLEVLIEALEATGEFKIVRSTDEIVIAKP